MYFLALPGTMGLKLVLDYNKYMYCTIILGSMIKMI